MPRGNEPLGDIASVVLFENERVKIWNLIVEPGETSPWHLHERDYVTVVVEGRRAVGGVRRRHDADRLDPHRPLDLPRRAPGAPGEQQHRRALQERAHRAEGLNPRSRGAGEGPCYTLRQHNEPQEVLG